MPRKKRKTNKRTSRKKISKGDYEFVKEIKKFADEEFKKRRVKIGDLVKLDYSVTTQEGLIVDTSIGFEADNCGILDPDREYKPIEIIVGNKETLKGIDNALINMTEGSEKTVILDAKDAFGKYDKRKLKRFRKKVLNFKHEPVIGESVALMQNGKVKLGIVRAVDEKFITVDFNHPLAGKKLVCSLRVLKIYD